MEYIKFENGLELPQIGFGTADLVGKVEDIVFSAIESGHRLIDTAQVYGSEPGVGKALNRAFEYGVAKREDLFIETKIAPEKHGYYEAMQCFEESLNKLQLDYIDMYLIHWPVARGSEDTYREKNIATWQAFEELKKCGKVKHIGVCNFLERHLLHIIDNCSVIPEVNQLEIHPGFQQRGLVRFCREKNIAIEAWSPMGRGVLNCDSFQTMAKKYNKDIGQLALRWSIQGGFVPLTRSSNTEHIRTNLNLFDFTIDDSDIALLNSLNSCDNHQDIWSYKRQQMY